MTLLRRAYPYHTSPIALAAGGFCFAIHAVRELSPKGLSPFRIPRNRYYRAIIRIGSRQHSYFCQTETCCLILRHHPNHPNKFLIGRKIPAFGCRRPLGGFESVGNLSGVHLEFPGSLIRSELRVSPYLDFPFSFRRFAFLPFSLAWRPAGGIGVYAHLNPISPRPPDHCL